MFYPYYLSQDTVENIESMRSSRTWSHTSPHRPGHPSPQVPNAQTPKLHALQPEPGSRPNPLADRGALLVGQPIADQRVDPVVARAEAAQLHALAVGDLLGVAVAPLDRHLAVGVGVDEHVEGAVAVELRQERHRRRDLAEDGGDLGLDLGLGLFRGDGGGRCGPVCAREALAAGGCT